MGSGQRTGKDPILAMMSKVSLKYRIKLVIAFSLFFAFTYGFTNRFPMFPLHYLPLTSVDLFFGFHEWTIWIYISDFVFIPLAYILVREPEDYSPMLYAMLIDLIVTCLIFIAYPTFIYRQPLSHAGDDWLRSVLYSIDSPSNCFPSLHVSLAIITALFVCKHNKQWGIVAALWAILIMISTMTIKQHYFVDVIGGVILAVISVAITTFALRRSAQCVI